MSTVDRHIRRVIERGSCSGCGLCPNLDSNWEMRHTKEGYVRPHYRGGGETQPHAARDFRNACPGVVVRAVHPKGAKRHPTMGSYFSVWDAAAVDSEVRFQGSSGGVLTALHVWLVESGRAARVTAAAADAGNRRRTVPVTIKTRAEALAAAGSRYAPVATLSNPAAFIAGSAVTGKPCEISARAQSAVGAAAPVLLSFYCAGTPSQHASNDLIARLGIDPTVALDEFWYRGRGWPGRFTARAGATTVDTSYEESWGTALGPTTQWRCKVCPDGVGESADIVAADFWRSDERGYPSFSQGDGASALIARTARGQKIVLEAIEAGVIHATPISMEMLARVQPLQESRRRHLFGRLAGSWLGGRVTPRYHGFKLLRLASGDVGGLVRSIRGTRRRVREARRLEQN